MAVVGAAAAARVAHLAPAARFRDDLDRQPHQRPHVGREHAVGARDQHDFVFAAKVRHHLRDARIGRAAQRLELFEEPYFPVRIQGRQRIERFIAPAGR